MSLKTKWVILAVAGTLTIAAIGLAYLWQSGWFSPSPAAVLKDTFAKANEGKYSEATANLLDGTLLRRDPDEMNKYWKSVTKEGTIAEVVILEEDLKGDWGHVTFEIKYKDGESVRISETVSVENGCWKHSSHDTYDKAVRLPPWKVRLMDEYTTLAGTNVSLRLPVGCKMKEKSTVYENSELSLSIRSHPALGQPLAAGSQFLEHFWKMPGRIRSDKKEVNFGNISGYLFQGRFFYPPEDESGKWWHTTQLAIGDEKHHFLIDFNSREEKVLVKLATECLLTAKWDEHADLAKKLTLNDNFTKIGPLYLRLPVTSKWNEKSNAMEAEELDVEIQVFSNPGISIEKGLPKVEERWKTLEWKLHSQHSVELPKVKGKLFEAEEVHPGGRPYKLFALVLGNERDHGGVSVRTPQSPALLGLVKEMLQTAKWDDDFFDPPGQLPEYIAKKLKLSDEFTPFYLTGVSMRLPVTAKWDAMTNSVLAEGLDARFRVSAAPGVSLEKACQKTESLWQMTGVKLVSEQEVDLGKVKGKLFEGKTKLPGGASSKWIFLFLGNEKNSVVIDVMVPEVDAIIKLVKESLKTVKWESEHSEKALAMLHYSVQAAPGLQMLQVLPKDQAVYFSEPGRPFPQKPEAGRPAAAVISFFNTPVDLKNAQAGFEALLNNLPPFFFTQKIEAIHPFVVGNLKGFEATSILSVEKINFSMFRYLAVLIKSETEWYLFEATAPVQSREQFEPRFKQMVRSFKLK